VRKGKKRKWINSHINSFTRKEKAPSINSKWQGSGNLMECATLNNITNSRRSYEYLRRIQGIQLYKMVGTVIHLTYKCASCAFVQKYLFKREYSDKNYCMYQHVLCKMWCICMSTDYLIKLYCSCWIKGLYFIKHTHTHTHTHTHIHTSLWPLWSKQVAVYVR